MTRIDQELLEQLCAWMDGELPADQARFLQRRLEREPLLRQQWERWQLASACLRGQPVRRMPASLADGIAVAIAAERRPSRWPWLAAAAAAVLVVVLMPRMSGLESGPASLTAAAADGAVREETGRGPIFVAATDSTDTLASPVAGTASVRDFPLVDTGRKPWPRSPVAQDGQALDAYMVRHNTLMAEDGLGGFMPYVDVVAQGVESTDAGQDARE